MKKKSYKKYLVFALLFGICAVSSVKAEELFSVTAEPTYTFSGLVGPFSWAPVGDTVGGALKTTPVAASAVKWTYTDKDSHKLWVRVVGSDKASKGSILVTEMNKSTGFSTNTVQGNYYNLEAKREHIIDPMTNEKGVWVP